MSRPNCGSRPPRAGAPRGPAGVGADGARSLLRLEGFSASVEHRLGELAELLGVSGIRALDGEASQALWREVRDATFLAEPREQAVWRISVAPTKGPVVVA